MAITNQERVGKAMEQLRAGLAPFVEREFKSQYQQQSAEAARRYFVDDRTVGKKPVTEWDVAALLKLMWEAWNEVFATTLGRAERSLVQELRDFRNKWAHQEPFSSDDTDRALDSMSRLLTAISSPQADEAGKMKMELRRLTYDEQVRGEKRKAGGSLIEAAATGTLKPCREIVTPLADVASGRYSGGVRGGLVAGASGRRLGRVQEAPGVLPPHPPHRESEAPARGRRAAPLGQGRRPGGAAPDQLRRRQDPFDAGALSFILGRERELAGVDPVLAAAGV